MSANPSDSSGGETFLTLDHIKELRALMTLLGAEYSVVGATSNNLPRDIITYSIKVGEIELRTDMPIPKIHVMSDHLDRLIFMRIFGVPEDQQDKLNRLMLEELGAADEY